MLNEFDKELEVRGLSFVRYADDCNIFVRSEKAANRVMETVTDFIAQEAWFNRERGEKQDRQTERY